MIPMPIGFPDLHAETTKVPDSTLILVVDDDRTSLRMLAETLEGKGYRVMLGICGQDAIELAGKGPELILLDFNLPDMDGLEVCRRLKADPAISNIPVIFITANHDPVLEARVLDAGAVDFVAKPYSVAVLRARINTHLMLKRNTDLLLSLANRDGLTGVANRRFFDEFLKKEWARAQRNQHPLSLILLDIDHFKSINDTFGHQEGDRCLRMLVQIVTRHLKRPCDLLARYGGEEFVLMLPETGAEGAITLAETIRTGIAAEFSRSAAEQGTAPRLTASFGCTTVVPSRDSDPEALLHEADQNLYRAKSAGRNRVMPPPASVEG